jgi:hypothetical protein
VVLLGPVFGLVACGTGGASSPAAPSIPSTDAPALTIASTSSSTTSTSTTTTSTTTTIAETTTTVAPIDPTCPETGHGAVIDRDHQLAWLCDDGVRVREFPVTTAVEQPDPGTYHVYAKSMHTTSRFGGHFTNLSHFVAFARGEDAGARVGFHAIPVLRNGELVQPIESVGDLERHGDSSGCIRARPDDAVAIWDWLSVRDPVTVVS